MVGDHYAARGESMDDMMILLNRTNTASILYLLQGAVPHTGQRRLAAITSTVQRPEGEDGGGLARRHCLATLDPMTEYRQLATAHAISGGFHGDAKWSCARFRVCAAGASCAGDRPKEARALLLAGGRVGRGDRGFGAATPPRKPRNACVKNWMRTHKERREICVYKWVPSP